MPSTQPHSSASVRPRHWDFWSLEREPFAPQLNWPADRELVYGSGGWQEAQARLRYVAEQQFGLAVVVGPPGAGKSLLLKVARDRLALQDVRSALHVCHLPADSVRFPLGRSGDRVVDALLAGCWQRTAPFADAAPALLILDDVISLRAQADLLFRFIERALPQLGGLVLTLPDTAMEFMEPLADLAPLMIRLPALPTRETAAYLQQRFAGAGGTGSPFTESAVELLQQHTSGVPRRLNRLAHECLLMATVKQQTSISAEIVSQIVSAGGTVAATTAGTRRRSAA